MRPSLVRLAVVIAATCAACTEDGQLRQARSELRDVTQALGKAGREVKDATKELARTAAQSSDDLRRRIGELGAAAQEASRQARQATRKLVPKPVAVHDRIHCNDDTCVIRAGLLDELQRSPERLFLEGALEPVSTPVAGLRLARLRPGGVGEALGLRDGDVLVTVDDRPVRSIADVLAMPRQVGPTPEVELGLRRGGDRIRLRLRLVASSPDVGAPG